MTKSKGRDPSPFRAGLTHSFLSVLAFSSVAGLTGLGVHITGDAQDAGPQRVVALFDTETAASRTLKDRFAVPTALSAAETTDDTARQAALIEPNLGVPDPGQASIPAQNAPPATETRNEPRGIRINGRTVLPGQSLSQVEQGAAASEQLGQVTTISATTPETDPAPAAREIHPNARPFANPDGKPMVGLIVGGLGTSYRHSIVAIDELPANVTLSFIADASPALLRRARDKGHEVLVEVPMEAYSTGRTRPHPNTLTVNATQDENAARLQATLRNKPGIFGVVTHDGAKLVADGTAVSAITEELARRDFAFFQHANLRRTTFETHADSLNMPFAAASENIDSRTEADAIETALLSLEATALEHGTALGTGFAFPVTVDTIKDWSERLQDKGILLAPASAIAAKRERPIQTTLLTDPSDTVQRTP